MESASFGGRETAMKADKEVEQGLDRWTAMTPKPGCSRRSGKTFQKARAKQAGYPSDPEMEAWTNGRIKGSNAESVSDANLEKINEAIVDASKANGAIDALKALDKIPVSDWQRQPRF
jgi:hypothetical protein